VQPSSDFPLLVRSHNKNKALRLTDTAILILTCMERKLDTINLPSALFILTNARDNGLLLDLSQVKKC
jgi:hypothetical protein